MVASLCAFMQRVFNNMLQSKKTQHVEKKQHKGWANTQTNQPTNQQSNKQAHKQANTTNKTNKQTNKQLNKEKQNKTNKQTYCASKQTSK